LAVDRGKSGRQQVKISYVVKTKGRALNLAFYYLGLAEKAFLSFFYSISQIGLQPEVN
jgi:hypothetical protein